MILDDIVKKYGVELTAPMLNELSDYYVSKLDKVVRNARKATAMRIRDELMNTEKDSWYGTLSEIVERYKAEAHQPQEKEIE